MLIFNRGTGVYKDFMITEAVFDAQALVAHEAILCQGNGYLGQRAALEEKYVGQTRNLFVAGTFDRFHESEVTELPNLPDVTNMSIRIDGVPFSMEKGKLLSYSRDLNLKTGEITRLVQWRTPEGKRLQLRFCRFVSMKNEHVLAFSAEITCLSDRCDVTLESGIDATVTNGGTQHLYEVKKRLLDERIMMLEEATVQSNITICLHATHIYAVDGLEIPLNRLPIMHRRYLGESICLRLEKEQTLRVEKLCCVHTSRDLVPEDGLRCMREALPLGYRGLAEESAEAWAALWEAADIRIESKSSYDQVAVRFAIYHLHIMVNKNDSRVGIGAKGLSGEGYKGHSFWDTEIFILPYFILTRPETARTLLEYRYLTLAGAKRKAEENGYQGAMYPWESAWIDDGEAAPLLGGADIVTGEQTPIHTGQIEQHITADIAYAVWQYWLATGDTAFMEQCGREILLETARFWESRAAWDDAKNAYVINDVIGPDEYKEHVNNNAYTNYMAHFNMELALRLREDSAMRHVMERLYLPVPDERGIIPQADRYFDLACIDLSKYKGSEAPERIFKNYNMSQINEMQVTKQADLLLLLLLLEDLFDMDTKRKNYQFYEERTLHDSSLSKSTHCVLALDLGLSEMGYRYFLNSCAIDLPAAGLPQSQDGIHSASMGGIWQCVVYGFGGVRITGDLLRIDPRLPENWASLSFRIVWRGQPLIVHADRAGVRVENMGIASVSVTICGEEREI
ncbi:MAG: glycosyl hydrolase family 65 protein [Bacillota bacterium]